MPRKGTRRVIFECPECKQVPDAERKSGNFDIYPAKCPSCKVQLKIIPQRFDGKEWEVV